MDERELAEELLRNHFLAAAALTALQLNKLPEGARTKVNDAIMSGTAHIELRTRLDVKATELVLVPIDGSAPLWLTRTHPPLDA